MNDNSETLLIAEDDENDLFFTLSALERAGVQNLIKVVGNGAEAIDYLAGRGNYSDRDAYPFPALMLLDIKMPIINGFEVLAWWHQAAHRPLQIIVLSGSDLPEDKTKAYSLGAAAYRVKGFHTSYLKFAEEIRDHWLPSQNENNSSRIYSNPSHPA